MTAISRITTANVKGSFGDVFQSCAVNRRFVAKLMAKGLVTVAAGENVVRLLPPLIIERAQVDEAVAILEALCRELVAQEAAR